jgi:hypothetical protein
MGLYRDKGKIYDDISQYFEISYQPSSHVRVCVLSSNLGRQMSSPDARRPWGALIFLFIAGPVTSRLLVKK